MRRTMRKRYAIIVWLALFVSCAWVPLVASAAAQLSPSTLPFAVRLGEEAEEAASASQAAEDGLAGTTDDGAALDDSSDLDVPLASDKQLSLANQEQSVQLENNRLRQQAAAVEQRDLHLQSSVTALRRKLAAAENRERSLGSESVRLKKALHTVEARQTALGNEDAQLRKKTALLASTASAWRDRAQQMRSKATDGLSQTKQLTVENARMRASILNVVSGAGKRVRLLTAEVASRDRVIKSEKLQYHRLQAKDSENRELLQERIKSLQEHLDAEKEELKLAEERSRSAEPSDNFVPAHAAQTQARALSAEGAPLSRRQVEHAPTDPEIAVSEELPTVPPAPAQVPKRAETNRPELISKNEELEARVKALTSQLDARDHSANMARFSAAMQPEMPIEVAVPPSQLAPQEDQSSVSVDTTGSQRVDVPAEPVDGSAGLQSDSAMLDEVAQSASPPASLNRLASDASLLDTMSGAPPLTLAGNVGGSPSDALLAEVHRVMSAARAKAPQRDAPISLLADATRHERRRVGLSSLESAVASEAREEARSSKEIAALHAQIKSWEHKPTKQAQAAPQEVPSIQKVASVPPVVGSLLADREVDDLDREVTNLETSTRSGHSNRASMIPAAALLETSAKRVLSIQPIELPVAPLHPMVPEPIIMSNMKTPVVAPPVQQPSVPQPSGMNSVKIPVAVPLVQQPSMPLPSASISVGTPVASTQVQVESPGEPTVLDERKDELLLRSAGQDVKAELPTQVAQAQDPIAAFTSQAFAKVTEPVAQPVRSAGPIAAPIAQPTPKAAEPTVPAVHTPDPIAAFVTQASDLRQRVRQAREAKASSNPPASTTTVVPAALDVSVGADDDIKSIVLDDDMPAVDCTSSSALAQTPASAALSGLDHFKALVGC